MEKIITYKSDNGQTYDSEEEAQKGDVEYMIRLNVERLSDCAFQREQIFNVVSSKDFYIILTHWHK